MNQNLTSKDIWSIREAYALTRNKSSKFSTEDDPLTLEDAVYNRFKYVIEKEVFSPPYVAAVTVYQMLYGKGAHWKHAEDIRLRMGLLDHAGVALNGTKAEYDEYKKGEQTRLADVQKRFKAEQSLLSAKASPDAVDYLAGLLDIQKIQLKDGKLEGFEEQLESLKKTKPTLFATVSVDSPAPEKGSAGNVDMEKQAIAQAMGLKGF